MVPARTRAEREADRAAADRSVPSLDGVPEFIAAVVVGLDLVGVASEIFGDPLRPKPKR